MFEVQADSCFIFISLLDKFQADKILHADNIASNNHLRKLLKLLTTQPTNCYMSNDFPFIVNFINLFWHHKNSKRVSKKKHDG